MAFTDSLCPDCLRTAQSSAAHPNLASFILLGIDMAPGEGQETVKSRHYACLNCTATWKATPRHRLAGDPPNPLAWELIDTGE